jgi:glutamate/tyrosine decarboxylase-like PLP-dependent enzyme
VSADPNRLDLTPEARATLGRAALDWCLHYFDTMPDRPVYPSSRADALRTLLAEDVPGEAQPLTAVMEQFARVVEHSRHNGHPRMFGYVQSSASFAGAIGDLLASALNLNVTSWRSAPAGTTIERQVIAWIASMIGLPGSSGGLFTSGGTMANLAALAAALRTATDIDVAEAGVGALAGQARIYASSMVHMSIPKAASLLGLGRASVRYIPVTDTFEMDAASLDRQLGADRAERRVPICVVGTAGDVNTGAIDPLDEIADVCARHQVWLHVDASYGGFAALAPSAEHALRGLGRADSVALDPHKWLFAPLDAGCLLVRDPAALHRAFAHGAAYVDVIADEHMSDFAFWDYGPELSRRFRALKIWFALKLHGRRVFAEAIESNLRVARHLAAAIDARPDFERLAPVALSIVCFRYVPEALRAQTAEDPAATRAPLNDLNRRIMLELQRAGEAYLSNAEIGGLFALRVCIVNYRTTEADADILLRAVGRVGDRLWYAQ